MWDRDGVGVRLRTHQKSTALMTAVRTMTRIEGAFEKSQEPRLVRGGESDFDVSNGMFSLNDRNENAVGRWLRGRVSLPIRIMISHRGLKRTINQADSCRQNVRIAVYQRRQRCLDPILFAPSDKLGARNGDGLTQPCTTCQDDLVRVVEDAYCSHGKHRCRRDDG